jgi:V-type H+-transporting ATPase subunit a
MVFSLCVKRYVFPLFELFFFVTCFFSLSLSFFIGRLIMAAFAAYLFYAAPPPGQRMSPSSAVAQLREARFIFLLMGLFSIYVGLIYNECFSVALPLFPSAWKFLGTSDTAVTSFPLSSGYVYPLGVDPTWRGTKSELAFTNSLKMKMSIIIGVVQMLVGIGLSAVNSHHFHRQYEFFTDVLPRFLFMSSMFGY